MDTSTNASHTSTPPPHPKRATSQRRPTAIIAAVITAALLAVITPLPRGFQGQATGNAGLVKEVEETLGSAHWHHVAAAKVNGDEVTWGGVGANENSEFEIGSITKTFTAALFADAIERGEIDESTRLGDVWPDLEGEVAQVSLTSIATQRSGLPKQEPTLGFGDGLASLLSRYLHTDPYRGTARDLVDSLKDADVGEKEPEYSNFAFGILGQALATVTGSSYGDLVRDRITEPLGMDSTYVPESVQGLPHGYTASGLRAAPWTLGGTAPSGAARSTVHDMSIWLRATMDGTAPGAKAIDPRADYDERDRIGWAWFTTKDRSPNLTWHNGGTGGYRSYLGFDPESHEGIVVLVDSANWVDDAADLISSTGDRS
ncbi:serine hydrolase [Brevibacterium aurantiacum]|uniref:Beta-lactamase family protein n=1 Tax=Brevibacterium aurantiacum TaxID=273384 RepID=A0A556C262_BREAU|nr:serine hydrolase domain-containing protein [Brevibacterium aurantiacum]TSI11533.1 beta-lactamase family protein [Brevibacterium aurantiacum]